MFILTTIQDLIQIAPQEFDKPSAQALKDAINEKYANKVIQNIGLCICLWDLLEASDGLIGHGTGKVNVNAEFRLAVFRPFRGEIIYGIIKSSTEEGIIIDLDFTCEVFVPYQLLQPNSTFSRAEDVWIWNTDDSELFYDNREPVLLRIEQEEWTDQKPTIVQKDENGEVIEDRDTAYRIIGSMHQNGLGPQLWWGEAAVEEEAEEAAEEMDDAEE
ncbi:DNA-directed RNA polymeras-like protein III 25 kDa polypeptide [Massariosphaeria phaeospora]|uniref:DNA-directed RNA polymerase subunit n=1 Tax=Massariosphaeria phaeospora TaxID=100035 RepID=A0A7C8ICW6_9PLEO|nr:DNA-directed RNA polymeras-like protein III 25 kDa polypeptide [Massariosphaeria phaeospora]